MRLSDVIRFSYRLVRPSTSVAEANECEGRADADYSSGRARRSLQNYQRAATIYFYHDRKSDFRRVMDLLRRSLKDLDKKAVWLFMTSVGERHFVMGKRYDFEDRADEAIREYMLALEFWPDNAQIHSNLGFDYGLRGELDKELAAYLKAVELDPNYEKGQMNVLVAYIERGREEDARTFLKRYPNLSPGDINRLIASARSGLSS